MLRRRMGAIGVIGTVIVALLVGCTNLIHSKRLPPCDQNNCASPPSGFGYSLPRGQFLLQASRHKIAEPDLTAAADAVAKANAAMKADMDSLVKVRQQQAADADKKPPSPATIEADKAAIADLTKIVDGDRELFTIAKKTLNDKKKDIGKFSETFTLTQQALAPDPRVAYTADLHHSCFRDDTIKIGLSNGLLTSASTTSVDQSLNILVSLAETAISVATFAVSGVPLVPPAPAGLIAQGVTAGSPLECSYDVSEVFDPLDHEDIDRVNKILSADHATIEIRPPESTVPTPTPAPSLEGLAYRVPVPVIVTVQPRETIDGKEFWNKAGPSWTDGAKKIRCIMQSKPGAQSVLAVIPDSRRNYFLPSDASAFTTTTLSYTFASGMLTEYDVTRPSEAAAPVTALGTLAKDILAIPGSILKLRLDYTNSSADVVKAQTALINARADQVVAGINARSALDNAKAALIKAQFGDRQAWVDAQQSLVSAEQALQKLIVGSTTSTTAPAGGKSTSSSP